MSETKNPEKRLLGKGEGGEKRPLRERVARMFGSRFRAGSYAAFAAAIVIAIAVAANLLAGALPEDVTQRKIVLDYLNAHEGVSAEEVEEDV